MEDYFGEYAGEIARIRWIATIRRSRVRTRTLQEVNEVYWICQDENELKGMRYEPLVDCDCDDVVRGSVICKTRQRHEHKDEGCAILKAYSVCRWNGRGRIHSGQ